MLEYIFIVINISALPMMGVITTLMSFLAIKKNNLLNRSLRNLSIAMLFYTAFAFFAYYTARIHYAHMAFAWGIAVDISYFVIIACWLRVLTVITHNENIVRENFLFPAIIIYGIVAESLWFLVTLCSAGRLKCFENGELYGKYLLVAANLCFGIWILYLAVRFFLYAGKLSEENQGRGIIRFFSGVLALYILFIIVFDYTRVAAPESVWMQHMAFDPLLMVYLLAGIATMNFFYKKDPLQLAGQAVYKRLEQGDAQGCSENFILQNGIQRLVEEKKLTAREADVVNLINKGMTNGAIGKELFISETTVKHHLNSVFKKANVTNRYELINLIHQYHMNGNR